MTNTLLLLTLAISFYLVGCATNEKVVAVQPGDQTLSCQELTQQLAKLDESQKQVDANKGLTGTNVASALFWLPGLAYTFYDAGQASEAINGRRSYLNQLYNDKNCH